jgi:hypothetical protein
MDVTFNFCPYFSYFDPLPQKKKTSDSQIWQYYMSWNFFFPQIDKIKLETGLPFLLQQIFTMQHFCINIQALGARFLGHWIGRDDPITFLMKIPT